MTTTEATRRLGIEHPVIQGPFGGGLSTDRLAAVVSELGGLGSYGVHHLAPDEIAGVAQAIRARTSRPFALNLWVSDHDPGGRALSEADRRRHHRSHVPVERADRSHPSPPHHLGAVRGARPR